MSQQHAYPFLSNPPSTKPKHRPQPISTPSFPRWTPAGRSPSFSRRRRSSASITCSTPSVYTPSPVFGSHSYSQHANTQPRRAHAPPSPSSPKRSPRRRQSPPSTPFAPPSRMTSRARGDSIVSSIAPPKTPTKTPKLAKIRSLTNLRGVPPVPSLPPAMASSSSQNPSQRARAPSQATVMTISGSKPSTKRAKRSATPAKNSQAFQKYRPMPFYQQMQIVQFLEGGTMESHIQRYHQEAGLGKSAKKGASKSTASVVSDVFGEDGPVHGYAFTDERGMIWFDEEEEWEFACLIPKMEREKKNKIKRMFGKGKGVDAEDEWEQFRDSSAEEDADSDEESDDAEWDEDDLASFGGDVATRRPAQSVLRTPKEKKEKPRRRRRSVKGQPPKTQPPQSPSSSKPRARRTSPTTLKQEFLATSFTPAPAPPSPRRSSPKSKPPAAATNSASRFALFGGKSRSRSASAFQIPVASLSVPTFHQPKGNGPYGSQSKPNTANNSVASFQSQARSEQVQWNWTEMPGVGKTQRPGTSSGVSGGRPSTDSVAPPMKAAKRLGVEAGVVVPMMHGELKKEKKGWFGRR